MNEILVARKAFAETLTNSAVCRSVTRNGTPASSIGAYSSRIAASARVESSCTPSTMRSGCKVSCTAKPSRRNSGFHATSTSTPGPRSRAGPLDKLGGGPDGNRGLADDHRRSSQTRCERVDYGVDVAQVGAVFAPLLRSADSQEMHVGEFGSQVIVGGEPKTASCDVVAQHLSQSRLVKRNVTSSQLGDLTGIDVDTDDLMPQFGHPGGVGGTQIARTEDGASHTPVCTLPQ